MAHPCGTTGSLCPTFVPARLVGLAVKRPYAIALPARLPTALRAPLKASVTLLEATTPVKLPAKHRPPPPRGLGPAQAKGGISTSAPRSLARPAPSLPPILHSTCASPMLSCSEGSRGLSVPLRVNGIFTVTYTIRAGRNLPDKEFRYLRTVIVTAAVYRGFNSGLPSR